MKTSIARVALLLWSGAALLLLPACSPKTEPAHRHDNHAKQENHSAHGHEHRPPHGGAAVVLGEEFAHLEFVRDPDTGRLSAYVFDGELENFIRIAQPSIEVVATVDGAAHPLSLVAVANPATGETVGDTSQFEAQADWLKTVGVFDAVVNSVTVRGTTFRAVGFNFPRGNEAD